MEPYFLCEVYVSSNGLSENAAYVFWPLMFSERSPKYENDASPVNVRPLAMFIVVFPCRGHRSRVGFAGSLVYFPHYVEAVVRQGHVLASVGMAEREICLVSLVGPVGIVELLIRIRKICIVEHVHIVGRGESLLVAEFRLHAETYPLRRTGIYLRPEIIGCRASSSGQARCCN